MTFFNKSFFVLFLDVKRSIELLDKLQKGEQHKFFHISIDIYIYIWFYIFYSGGEVPTTKLAALQKVLQSDFLSAVREVYEHVYETVDIQVKL